MSAVTLESATVSPTWTPEPEAACARARPIRDVMMREPRASAPTRRSPRSRAFFSPRKKLLLVTDGERFLGTLARDDLPAEGDGPIGPHVSADPPR